MKLLKPPSRKEASKAQPDFPLDLLLRVCELLSPNEIACTSRLICKTSAKHFSDPHHKIVRLSRPVPPHAFAGRYGRGADPGPLKQLSLAQKQRLFAITASTGALNNVATLVERMEPPFWWRMPRAGHQPDADACAAAARNRHMHVVRFLLARSYPCDMAATIMAAVRHLDLADVRWLMRQRGAAQHLHAMLAGIDPPVELLMAAASLDVPDATAKLEWLLTQAGKRAEALLQKAAIAAAHAGSLAGLQWVLRQMDEDEEDEVVQAEDVVLEMASHSHHDLLCAAASGNALHVAAWLLPLDQESLTSGVEGAALGTARSGQVESLRQLLPLALAARRAGESRAALLRQAAWEAAGSGRSGVMRLVSELHAAHGHTEGLLPEHVLATGLAEVAQAWDGEAVRWLWERCEGRSAVAAATTALRTAVRVGCAPMAAFLLDAAGGCWGDPLCLARNIAASGTSDEDLAAVLRVLNERSCLLQLDMSGLAVIVSRGRLALVQWLHGHGLLRPEHLACPALLSHAAAGGCEALVEWLLAAGCPVGQDGGAYLLAGRNGDLDMLRCLRRAGVPCCLDTVCKAVKAQRRPAGACGGMDSA